MSREIAEKILATCEKTSDSIFGAFALSMEIAEELREESPKLARAYLALLDEHASSDVAYTIELRGTESDGYWVKCPEAPGTVTEGKDVPEALEMMADAWRLMDD